MEELLKLPKGWALVEASIDAGNPSEIVVLCKNNSDKFSGIMDEGVEYCSWFYGRDSGCFWGRYSQGIDDGDFKKYEGVGMPAFAAYKHRRSQMFRPISFGTLAIPQVR